MDSGLKELVYVKEMAALRIKERSKLQIRDFRIDGKSPGDLVEGEESGQ
jgi:hypothetical protein